MDAYTIQQEIPVLINSIKKEAGLSPLKFNPILTNVAKQKNQDMMDKDYFAHKDSKQKFIWEYVSEADYPPMAIGENLGMKFSTAKEVVDALMASPTHKKNILNENYQDVGYSIIPKDEKYMMVQVFGKTKANLNDPAQYVHNPNTNDVLSNTTGSLQDWANYGYSPISQQRYNDLHKPDPLLTDAVKRESQEKIRAITSVPPKTSSRLESIVETGTANYSSKPNRAFTNALYLEFHNRKATEGEFKRFNDMSIKDTANIIAGKEIIKV